MKKVSKRSRAAVYLSGLRRCKQFNRREIKQNAQQTKNNVRRSIILVDTEINLKEKVSARFTSKI